jgi:hypothetical protein
VCCRLGVGTVGHCSGSRLTLVSAS